MPACPRVDLQQVLQGARVAKIMIVSMWRIVLVFAMEVEGENANQFCNTVGMLSLSEWYVGLFFIPLCSCVLWATDEAVERYVK